MGRAKEATASITVVSVPMVYASKYYRP